jgi:hypothetical protein
MPKVANTKNERLAAKKYFQEGLSVQSVMAKMPHISQRTIFRWHKEYKDENGLNAVVETDIEAIILSSDSGISAADWVKSAETHAQEILDNNAKIRRRLETLLLNEIEKEADINLRSVNILAAAVCNFQKQEWLFGSFAYLDINKAAKLLNSVGYVLSLPKELKEQNNDSND